VGIGERTLDLYFKNNPAHTRREVRARLEKSKKQSRPDRSVSQIVKDPDQ